MRCPRCDLDHPGDATAACPRCETRAADLATADNLMPPSAQPPTVVYQCGCGGAEFNFVVRFPPELRCVKCGATCAIQPRVNLDLVKINR